MSLGQYTVLGDCITNSSDIFYTTTALISSSLYSGWRFHSGSQVFQVLFDSIIYFVVSWFFTVFAALSVIDNDSAQ